MKADFPTAHALGLASCHTCGRLGRKEDGPCQRCGTHLHLRKESSLQRCLAYSLAAVVAYIPANLMPIMIVSGLGGSEPSTILSGVANFWETQAYPVAIVIFTASVVIPGLKFIALGYLSLAASGILQLDGKRANRIYWVTELVGRWSMVDVFVVAILVGLVQLGGFMTIKPGPAVISFGLVVILTMLAAHAFEPKLIWDRLREIEEE